MSIYWPDTFFDTIAVYSHEHSMENETSARDVFMYLLVVVVLAMSAANLGTLLFQYVNIYLPDTTSPICTGTWCRDAIRWSLASIIVVFPVLIWAWHFLQRDVLAHPEKEGARVRRWLLYLTLFVAGGFLIGDAVSLIYGWLQGSLTIQFALKVLVVLYIAATVFYYFLKALHRQAGHAKIVGWLAVLVVSAAVIVGFVSSGSPFRVRLERLDEQRISNLEEIQNQIVMVYWQSKGKLPNTLADLNDTISGFRAPVDPQTKQAYEYFRKGERAFALCATFVTSTTGITNGTNTTWVHGEGRVCFDRTVDPQLYPVNPKLLQ